MTSSSTVIERDFELLTQRFPEELYRLGPLGLLSTQEQFQILSDWDSFAEPVLAEEVLENDPLYRNLAEHGFGVKGNYFTEPPTELVFREWYPENLILDPNETIWGEELGFYEFDGLCVAKSILNNTHLIWLLDQPGHQVQHYASGGIEFTFPDAQITTRQDVFERFGIDLVCDTVIISQ